MTAIPGEGVGDNLAREAIDPLPGRSLLESFIEQGKKFDMAIDVNYSGFNACYHKAVEAGLDPSLFGRPRALLELTEVDHAVLGYINETGQVIIIDNTKAFGAAFGSRIPANQYMQNIGELTQFSTFEEMSEAVFSGKASKDAFSTYITGFPSGLRLSVSPDLDHFFKSRREVYLAFQNPKVD